MANKDGKLVLKDKNGKEKEYTVLASFRFNGKYFVIYTNYKRDEKRKILVFASILNPDDEENKIEQIKDKQDQEFVNKYIKKLEEDMKLKMKLI